MILSARGVDADAGRRPRGRKRSLHTEEGKIVTLSVKRSGKNTILKTISGLEPAVSGEIVFEGEELKSCDPGHREAGYRPRSGR